MNEKNDGKFSWIDKNSKPRKISYKNRDNSSQRICINLLKRNSKNIMMSPNSKVELSSINNTNYKYDIILSKNENNEKLLNSDSNNFNEINNNMKKENIIENNKGKDNIDIIEKNIINVHIESYSNKKNNDNNKKNKGNISNKNRKSCNVRKITKSKNSKNLNIPNNNFTRKKILENNLQTEANNNNTYRANDDRFILNFRNKIKNNLTNIKRMPNEYYQYKSLFTKIEPSMKNQKK